MMARSGSNYPTELELEILKILWDTSPLPVRDVRARLAQQAGRPLSHSSVITMLNIMVRKGYLRRKKDGKAFLFTPQVERQSVSGGIVGDLLARVFDGSPSAMVLNLIETADLDADEVAELRRLIARKTKEQQK
ncbi:MAG: BlaI/MecI/CopY family transcriptional regulator [Planctomycetia bacterium]|nr:BlaI/MecI/CopY family transcriptional regulator [Planctomycetia bacterium]